MRRLLGLGLVTAAATVGLVAAVITRSSNLQAFQVMLLVASVAFVAVGIVVVARSDATRVGWALALVGLSLIGSGLFSSADGSGDPVSPGMAGPSVAAWFGTFAGIGMLMAWFPTGTTAGRRWRWLTPLGVTVTALVIGASLLSERVCMEVDGAGCVSWAANPIGIRGVPNPEYEWGQMLALLVAFILLAAVSMVVRFVRSTGVERLQLKWFAAAVGLFALWLAVGTLTEVADIALPDAVGDMGVGVVMLALPVTVGLAVTRYRLYDIDRIISRTVAYTLVAVVVAGIYALPVVTLPRLLGESNDLVIAGSTLVAAAAFTPVRRRVQRTVDHRFNRTRFDTEREVEVFSDRLRSNLTLESVDAALAEAVVRTVQPSLSRLWIRERRP
ncbi:MAG TPA: hypothetical protein VIY70_14950 [Acidimicrobiia bacterium]